MEKPSEWQPTTGRLERIFTRDRRTAVDKAIQKVVDVKKDNPARFKALKAALGKFSAIRIASEATPPRNSEHRVIIAAHYSDRVEAETQLARAQRQDSRQQGRRVRGVFQRLPKL